MILLAIMESRSGNDDSFIDEEIINEVDAPLIQIDEDMDTPVPPEAE